MQETIGEILGQLREYGKQITEILQNEEVSIEGFSSYAQTLAQLIDSIEDVVPDAL